MKKQLVLAAVSLAISSVSHGAEAIKIPTHNWSSQIVGAFVVGKILGAAGNEVEFVENADSQAVYQAMCEGDVDLVHEVWEGAFGENFEKVVAEGCVIDAATHDAVTREEWWYPTYVEEQCPGLPDWQALNKCAAIFATAETEPKGRFLAGPADWLKNDDKRVKALGINFEVVNAGTADAIWAELKAASEAKRPIVHFNWTPNFVEAQYEGKFIEFPEHDPRCTSDASWGVNPDEIYDCGNPAHGYLKIGVWKGFPDKNPEAYKVVQQINFTNAELAEMARLVDVEKMSAEDAAAKWFKDNESKWRGWL